jgi:hypothetical protein
MSEKYEFKHLREFFRKNREKIIYNNVNGKPMEIHHEEPPKEGKTIETMKKSAEALTKMFSDNIDPKTFDSLKNSTKILITVIKVFKFLLGIYVVEKINGWLMLIRGWFIQI